jgi:hypothetical protein
VPVSMWPVATWSWLRCFHTHSTFALPLPLAASTGARLHYSWCVALCFDQLSVHGIPTAFPLAFLSSDMGTLYAKHGHWARLWPRLAERGCGLQLFAAHGAAHAIHSYLQGRPVLCTAEHVVMGQPCWLAGAGSILVVQGMWRLQACCCIVLQLAMCAAA